jgi:beta-glucuronidase
MNSPTSHNTADPFHHLHDEDYAQPFEQPSFTHDTMVAMGGRQARSLDGAWQFTLDLFDEGLRQKWYADEPAPPETWIKPRDYDAGAGGTLEVPSCWNMSRPEWLHFEGGAWYTRFIIHQACDGLPRTVLRIGAANYQARVFLDGRFLGTHRGGSTPFFVELTGLLHSGRSHRLQIQVDNRRERFRVPMNHFDWFNQGGLYREVSLLDLPGTFIRHASLQLVPDGSFSRLQLELQLSDAVDEQAQVVVPELGIQATVAVKAGRAQATLESRPSLWSPDAPKRYDVVFRCAGDEVFERIGFREVRTQGSQLLLNGAPIYLKGICVHEDDLHLGKVSTEADVRQRFADARALGCNFLRLSHYPHHEHVAQMADELGFMLWEEVPVYWAIQFDNPATLADARNQLLELIHRDINRASVILWGVGNENADTDARYHFMRALAQAARASDPTRLIGAACLINREHFRIEDRLAEHLDVIGLNEYFGWYEPEYEGLRRLLGNSTPGKPVIVSETGADALAGHRGGPRELFSEDCQAEIYRQQVAMVGEAPYVCGFTPWLLYDFRSERRQTVFNRGFNRKGLIAEDKRTRKLAFDVLASHYHSRP